MAATFLAVEVEVVAQTAKAVCVKIDDEEYWLPWSDIEDNNEDFKEGYRGKMWIAKWLCDREDIEGEE